MPPHTLFIGCTDPHPISAQAHTQLYSPLAVVRSYTHARTLMHTRTHKHMRTRITHAGITPRVIQHLFSIVDNLNKKAKPGEKCTVSGVGRAQARGERGRLVHAPPPALACLAGARCACTRAAATPPALGLTAHQGRVLMGPHPRLHALPCPVLPPLLMRCTVRRTPRAAGDRV